MRATEDTPVDELTHTARSWLRIFNDYARTALSHLDETTQDLERFRRLIARAVSNSPAWEVRAVATMMDVDPSGEQSTVARALADRFIATRPKHYAVVTELTGAKHVVIVDQDGWDRLVVRHEIPTSAFPRGERFRMPMVEGREWKRDGVWDVRLGAPRDVERTGRDYLDDIKKMSQAVALGQGISLDNEHAQAVIDALVALDALRARLRSVHAAVTEAERALDRD
jgi:hypothetical protein